MTTIEGIDNTNEALEFLGIKGKKVMVSVKQWETATEFVGSAEFAAKFEGYERTGVAKGSLLMEHENRFKGGFLLEDEQGNQELFYWIELKFEKLN